jgi:hypothetical protein
MRSLEDGKDELARRNEKGAGRSALDYSLECCAFLGCPGERRDVCMRYREVEFPEALVNEV